MAPSKRFKIVIPPLHVLRTGTHIHDMMHALGVHNNLDKCRRIWSVIVDIMLELVDRTMEWGYQRDVVARISSRLKISLPAYFVTYTNAPEALEEIYGFVYNLFRNTVQPQTLKALEQEKAKEKASKKGCVFMKRTGRHVVNGECQQDNAWDTVNLTSSDDDAVVVSDAEPAAVFGGTSLNRSSKVSMAKNGRQVSSQHINMNPRGPLECTEPAPQPIASSSRGSQQRNVTLGPSSSTHTQPMSSARTAPLPGHGMSLHEYIGLHEPSLDVYLPKLFIEGYDSP
ncbi:hypothetical protein BJ165DRAFT_1399983 [Panaeolus papilionaceus]|nr:hypothetical protein BJ165DRAFT_1399983 [Panaeolus papilionaceus]